MIIAYTGKRGHGKSTAAETLEAAGFKHINFGDPVKQVAMLVYGLSHAECYDALLKEKVLGRWPFKSPREILQRVGTESFRHYISETWTEKFKRTAAEIDGDITLSDLRFLNEEICLNELGAIIVRVVNPRVANDDVANAHQSETEMDKIVPHHIIINDGTIKELQEKVWMLLESLEPVD